MAVVWEINGGGWHSDLAIIVGSIGEQVGLP